MCFYFFFFELNKFNFHLFLLFKVHGIHEQLLKRVGPDWYQELSNQQLRTVDNLHICILKDIRTQTVINTKENIAKLGLVLRPNTKHVEIALSFCCGCPVEFLLILYQVLNPKSKFILFILFFFLQGEISQFLCPYFRNGIFIKRQITSICGRSFNNANDTKRITHKNSVAAKDNRKIC